MRIMICGANGQLGSEMRLVLKGSGHECFFTDVVGGSDTDILDITDKDGVMGYVRDKSIECIVNCAAYTNVEAAESDEEAAELLNVTAVGNLAEAMRGVGGLLIHVSTDYVFGGDPYNTPCTEEQDGKPVGVYGRTKLEGERLVIGSGCKYVILRTSWLYSEYGRNFVKTMLSLMSTRDEVRVVFDQVGTPTYAYDLACGIMRVIGGYDDKKQGIYNFSNEGVCSWYDFTKAIAEYGGNVKCAVVPCKSSEYPSSVRRPSYSVLDKSKFKEAFGVTIPYWRDSLYQCIKKMSKP